MSTAAEYLLLNIERAFTGLVKPSSVIYSQISKSPIYTRLTADSRNSRIRTYLFSILFSCSLIQISCSSGDSNSNNDLEDPAVTPTGGDVILSQQPWLGNWIQVNFLVPEENGIWSEDVLEGIGFTASVSETTWIETEDGCSVTYQYTVGNNLRYSKTANSVSENCPFSITPLLNESGTLEFSENDVFMVERFDLVSGDEIVAFKWMRQ